ncbi:Ser-Thr-rich glycosyl-phosphatidyl-inositol-anchored membrane family-domain-containing protein [Schizothecium vesticola]|uniref:Ser-Thr-rich glycosyl-phosphatidyl-inositol-anchored membrane family-domain-containing protein n=1 Tax=Schizothecium vesticola TaxID=314040 RepID=A0AA40KD05_9PEZI|nr:Ser-Thr-rich glycosyl-phosphatidyl-inositol-anchored membrane family-domain-containing protein [Schizothecium vesticola]
MVSMFPLVALVAPLVAAIDFSSPAANSTVTKGKDFTLSWNTVDTDPTKFSIYLVNFVNWPPFYTPLAYNVDTAAGQTKVKVPCAVDNSYGYQFNAINGTNVYVIYAQTDKFSVTGASCVDSTPPLEPPTCADEPAVVVTATVTVTVSKPTSFHPSGRTTTTSHSTTTTAVPTVSPGKCPYTIGWGTAGYANPVTLTRTPHAPGPTEAPAGGPKGDEEGEGETRTVYSTVFRDLSEVQDCRAW